MSPNFFLDFSTNTSKLNIESAPILGSKQYYSFFQYNVFFAFSVLWSFFWSSGFLFIRFSGFSLLDQLV